MSLIAGDDGSRECQVSAGCSSAVLRMTEQRVTARSQTLAVWWMSPRSMRPVTSPSATSTLVSVMSAWLTPLGNALDASAAAAHRARSCPTSSAVRSRTVGSTSARTSAARRTSQSGLAVGRGVEEPLEGDAHPRGDGADRLGERGGDGGTFCHVAGQDGDDAGQALPAVGVDDGRGPRARQGRHRARQGQVGVDPGRVGQRHRLEVDGSRVLGRVGHLEHVLPVDHGVEVAFAGQVGDPDRVDPPVLTGDPLAVLGVQPRGRALENVASWRERAGGLHTGEPVTSR